MRAVGVLLRRQDWLTYLAAALALAAVVLMLPIEGSDHPTHAGTTADLSVSWVNEEGRVEIVAAGFRRRSLAEVRVGAQPRIQVRADSAGLVRVAVAVDESVKGQPGTSVLVVGRASSGSARALVGAVPPRPTGRGPVDVAPWSLLAVALAAALVWNRRRERVTVPANA